MTPRKQTGHAKHSSDIVGSQRRYEALPPAKRRIAEALAALLVAHYRREHERPDRDHRPIA